MIALKRTGKTPLRSALTSQIYELILKDVTIQLITTEGLWIYLLAVSFSLTPFFNSLFSELLLCELIIWILHKNNESATLSSIINSGHVLGKKSVLFLSFGN